MRGGGPGCPAHDEKRLAEHRRVGAGEKRLGHRNPGRERGLQHGEFLQAAEARRDPGRGVGAQHETLVAIEPAARKTRVDAPIFLDRTAAEQRQPGDLTGRRSARRGEEPRQ